MQQTEQFKLSQWEPEDRILREDFNSDNAAIEAALLALRSDKLEKTLLYDYERDFKDLSAFSYSSQALQLWSCQFLVFDFSAPQDSTMYINKDLGTHWTPSDGVRPGFASLKAGVVSRFLFLPLGRPDSLFSAWTFSGPPMYCYTEFIFDNFSSLSIRRDSGKINGKFLFRITAFK